MNETFVFDTYALIEILKKNPNYEKYMAATAITNNFIFAEFCYNLYKDKVKNSNIYIAEIKPTIASLKPELKRQCNLE